MKQTVNQWLIGYKVLKVATQKKKLYSGNEEFPFIITFTDINLISII